jgi:hypothetical protein
MIMPGRVIKKKTEWIEILDIPFELRFSDKTVLPLNPALRSFTLSCSVARREPTVIDFVDNSFEGIGAEEYLYQRRPSISMAVCREGLLFSFFTGQFLASNNFRKIQLWSPFERRMSIDRDGYANYNGDPTLRLILWGRASFEHFSYVHASLVVLDNKYILFMGASGTGKSTLADCVCSVGGTCLTDENPFVSWYQDTPFTYGTPWSKLDNQFISASGPLAAIFFLRHAPKNNLRKLGFKEKTRNLLHNTRPFNWLPETIPANIALIDKIAGIVPAYDFGFVPDHSAIDTIRNVL